MSYLTDPNTPCRDTSLLSTKMQELVPKFIVEAAKQGIILKILETYRTEARQKLLLAQKKSWKQHSLHQDGNAVDLIPIDAKNNILWNTSDDTWLVLAKIWLGLDVDTVWGGNWQVRDLNHFQLGN